ncbi:hypothetical protein Dimus_020594 [Dionaea muscipula]
MNQQDFDWEAVIDEAENKEEEVHEEAEVQGESGSREKFFYAEDEVELERAQADRIEAELDRVQAENA